jgi:hypothetical protein
VKVNYKYTAQLLCIIVYLHVCNPYKSIEVWGRIEVWVWGWVFQQKLMERFLLERIPFNLPVHFNLKILNEKLNQIQAEIKHL